LHVATRILQHLLVSNSLTDAHIQRYLGDAGNFHYIFQTELLLDLTNQVVLIFFL